MKEIEKYHSVLLKKTHGSQQEFENIIQELKQHLQIIPTEEFAFYILQTEPICPDPNDTSTWHWPLYLNCPLWSNNKKLKEQNVVAVFNTKELLMYKKNMLNY